MNKKFITAKTLRSNLREVLVDISQNNTEYVLEYIKGIKVIISPFENQKKVNKFAKYIKTRNFKPSKDNYSNDELRKMAYDK